jgi:DUSAM domain-containing protein
MGYKWQPTAGDWDRLREIEVGGGQPLDSRELSALVDRTFACLGFSRADADRLAAGDGGRQYVLEARNRIRSGSRRLGNAIIASHDLTDQGRFDEAREELKRFMRDEPVLYYREIAEVELCRVSDVSDRA